MNITLYRQCAALRGLDHNEKHVLVTLASFACQGSIEAYPSISTLAGNTSLGKTTVREKLRALEGKRLVEPRGNTKGGKGCTTVYAIHPKNWIPTALLMPLADSNPSVSEPIPTGFGGNTHHPGGDEGFKEKEEGEGNEKRSPDFPSEMADKIWAYYIECVEPGNNYSFTISRKRMLADRYREMIAKGRPSRDAGVHLAEAISAFSDDDFHMGRKKGYEGAGRKGFEEIFRTQDVFEGWCARYQDQ